MFHIPDGMIYLDGNSLGPLPKAAASKVASMMQDEWGEMLITGWNRAGWMELSTCVGDRIARLIGAEPGSVIMGDTLSSAKGYATDVDPTTLSKVAQQRGTVIDASTSTAVLVLLH